MPIRSRFRRTYGVRGQFVDDVIGGTSGGGGGTGVNLTTTTVAISTAMAYPNNVYLVNAVGGDITMTLPDATAVTSETNFFHIKKVDSSFNNVIVATSGGQTIDGGASPFTFNTPQQIIMMVSDGSNWHKL